VSRFEQFGRFAIVGGIATAIHYAILIVFVQGGLAGTVSASSIGFAASVLFNYALNRSFTFHSRRAHTDALPKFMIVALIGLVLNGSLVWLFHVSVGLHYLLAQVLATVGTLSSNFALNRAWTFPQSSVSQVQPRRETP
jgi:putative flippase GtrA